MTLGEITMLRHPSREPTADAVFVNRDRRRRRDPDSGEEVAHLSLPDGAIWVTAGDSYVDLARHRIAAADPVPLAGDHGINTPVLELWLTPTARQPSSGLRIAVLKTIGKAPGDVQRMLAHYLVDDSIVGVQMCDDECSTIRRMALKVEAIELLRAHGHLHVRTADVPVSPTQLNSRLQRFTTFNNELEAWDTQLKRFFRNVGSLSRRPVPAVTGAITIAGAIIAALHRLGVV